MKVSTFRSMAVALILVFVSVGSVMADIPTGWLVAGSAPKDYDFSRDGTTRPAGNSAPQSLPSLGRKDLER